MIGCGGVTRPDSELGTAEAVAGAPVLAADDGATELDVDVGVLPPVVATGLDVVSADFKSPPFSVVEEGGAADPFEMDDG